MVYAFIYLDRAVHRVNESNEVTEGEFKWMGLDSRLHHCWSQIDNSHDEVSASHKKYN